MRIATPHIVIAGVLLCAGIVAQNDTVPATLNGVEGGSGTGIPFGSNLSCRYQCIYDAEELPWTGPRAISGIRIRPDFNNGAATSAKGFLQLSVLMSTTSRDSSTMSATFDDNYGTDAMWVAEDLIVMLPAQPVTTTSPRPANIDLPFTNLWVYGLTPATTGLPAPDNLLVEIWIKYQPSGSYRVDNLGSCTAPVSTFGLVGPQCAIPDPNNPGSNLPPIDLSGDTSMLAGSNYTWRISNAQPSMPFMLLLNLTDQGTLFGNPSWALPYPLFDPANPSLPSPAFAFLNYAAPDCYLNVLPTVVLGSTTDQNGDGQVTAAIPPGRQNVGGTYYAQALAFAPTANPLFFISSQGRSTTICGPLGVTRVYKFYNTNGNPLTAPPSVGTRSAGVGLVLDVY
ncbi:MAG TPA: hypothetical protein ENI87_00010 [bacterium]|nr:hypothetical protein [bacterium]